MLIKFANKSAQKSSIFPSKANFERNLIKKIHFTLLELMVVLAILGAVAGFIGINISKALREQRFRTEVSLIVDQLRLAQNLMLIFNSNVQLKFIGIENEGIDYHLVFDTPLPQRWSKEINRPHERLTTIRSFNFRDLLDPDESGVVKFLSGGSKMSRGIIRISTSKSDNTPGVLTRYIFLPGYPAPIESQTQFPEEALFNSNINTFEQTLTQRTKEEVELNVKEL